MKAFFGEVIRSLREEIQAGSLLLPRQQELGPPNPLQSPTTTQKGSITQEQMEKIQKILNN